MLKRVTLFSHGTPLLGFIHAMHADIPGVYFVGDREVACSWVHTRRWRRATTWHAQRRCPSRSAPRAQSPAPAASWPAGCRRAPVALPLHLAGRSGCWQSGNWSPPASRSRSAATSAAQISLFYKPQSVRPACINESCLHY